MVRQNGKVLTYTCEDGTSFNFKLMQGDTELTFTRITDEPEPGRYQDSYVVEHISSNDDVRITCPNVDFNKVCIRYDGNSLGMWEEDGEEYWATDFLNKLTDGGSDKNHYQFRIESVHNQENSDDGEEGDQGEQIPIENLIYNVDFGTASWTVIEKKVTASIEGKTINNGQVQIKGNEIIKLSKEFDSKFMQVTLMVTEPDVEPERWFRTRLTVNDNNETSLANMQAKHLPNDKTLEILVEKLQSYGPEMPQLPEGNTTAKVTVSSNQGHIGSYVDGRICINGYEVPPVDYHEGNTVPESTEAEVKYSYNEKENNSKVTLTFESLFIKKYVGTIKVNGVSYNVKDYIDYTDRTDWLDHYSCQCVRFDIDVDWAENYDIIVDIEDQEGKNQYIGNFLWTIDPDEKESDDYIGNSRLELVKVVYWMDFGEGEEEIEVLEENLYRDPYIEYNPDGLVGSLVVPEGAMCTMRIIPDYGYQVTSFGINGQDIITGDAISEFTFPIHKGNFHLGAQVTKVEDIVNAKSEKVKSGNIEIGKGEIDTGSVVLSVNDIKPEDVKIKEFEKAAGDYEIYSYLDIDLDQVIYKGTSEDVWYNRIHNLNNEATITLQLEEGINGNDVVIVHNINDGDKYEVIEITSYDPATNTITFKTKSFSNYAIATKTSAEEKYTIKTENYELSFTDVAGHEFKVEIGNLWNLTDKEIAEIGISAEEYKETVNKIEENVKTYGTVLNLYDITVADNQYVHSSEVSFKIKMTDEMKKYNTFKLVNIDENDFSAKDVVELKQDGEYLVGTLPHLSVYALVADNVATENNESSTNSETNTSTENNASSESSESNPVTGDTIAISLGILVIGIIGAIATVKFNKTKKH